MNAIDNEKALMSVMSLLCEISRAEIENNMQSDDVEKITDNKIDEVYEKMRNKAQHEKIWISDHMLAIANTSTRKYLELNRLNSLKVIDSIAKEMNLYEKMMNEDLERMDMWCFKLALKEYYYVNQVFESFISMKF